MHWSNALIFPRYVCNTKAKLQFDFGGNQKSKMATTALFWDFLVTFPDYNSWISSPIALKLSGCIRSAKSPATCCFVRESKIYYGHQRPFNKIFFSLFVYCKHFQGIPLAANLKKKHTFFHCHYLFQAYFKQKNKKICLQKKFDLIYLIFFKYSIAKISLFT